MDEAEPGSTMHGELGRLNLEHGVIDLLLAGSETSSTSLDWGLLFLAKYQDVQQKLYQELCKAFGPSAPSKMMIR